jgi:hypothetical protein
MRGVQISDGIQGWLPLTHVPLWRLAARICPRSGVVLLASPDRHHGVALLVQPEVKPAVHVGEDDRVVDSCLGFDSELSPPFNEGHYNWMLFSQNWPRYNDIFIGNPFFLSLYFLMNGCSMADGTNMLSRTMLMTYMNKTGSLCYSVMAPEKELVVCS